MTIDLAAVSDFLATHGRILDRRRFELLLGETDPSGALDALSAYRNPDGGYGWGLEPDLRSRTSQPAGALHAFEVLREVAPATAPEAAQLCDWLATAALADGGLPFALPVPDPAGCAPFWTGADSEASSLHITAAVTAMAWRVARHDPAVAEHPWLAGSTRYCLDAIAAREQPEHALELKYSLELLDAVHDGEPTAPAELRRLGQAIPASGLLHVEGGLDDEFMRPLDFAPLPDRPLRKLFTAEAVDTELDRLAARQSGDGGWPEEWHAYSPAAALEWRGYLTVRAVWILLRNGRMHR